MNFISKPVLLSSILSCLIVMSCAPKIIPEAGQSGFVNLKSNMITKDKEGIIVSVQSEEWKYTPYSLNEYFTPFHFLIRNNTEEKVEIKYSGLVLFDGEGNQYEAIPPDGVEYMMASRELYEDRADILFRFEETRPPFTYGLEFPAYARRPFSNISLYSLPAVQVYPDSQVRGFVYFKKVSTHGNSLRLKVELDGFREDFEFTIKK